PTAADHPPPTAPPVLEHTFTTRRSSDLASTGAVVTRTVAEPVEATSMTNRPVRCPFDRHRYNDRASK
ncbi:MAG: hypothetical protein LBS86_01665, partial [Treponema sp.]|nr:hypothetical protein [Treponema sp.]